MLVKTMGSSLVRDLYNDTNWKSRKDVMLPEFGMGIHHTVDFSWIAGGTAVDFSDHLGEAMGHRMYDLVIILGGGNDLSSTSPEVVASRYMELIDTLQTDFRVPYIIFCQVSPRDSPRYIMADEYRHRVTILNAMMANYLEGEESKGRKFWKNRGLWNASELLVMGDNTVVEWPISIFRDGVHFNRIGQIRLYHSIRRAIKWVVGCR